MEKDPFVYRIITDKGTVDFSPTYEGIMKKYRQYATDMELGYSQFVSVEWENPSTKDYRVLFMKRRGIE
jgi:hypothetical protein